MPRISALAPTLCLLLAVPLMGASGPPPAAPQVGPSFPYGSPAFQDFGHTSYALAGMGGAFQDWLDAAYARSGVLLGDSADSTPLAAALDARATAIRAASGAARVGLERDTATWAHTFVKRSIPKFSLDRGFELANVARTGERQCLAQSVIVAALLQRAGVAAGAVMVWSNQKGFESNLGHVVTVARLSSGSDLLVDASDPQPFMEHQGLLLRDSSGAYRFLKPVYAADSSVTGYIRADGGQKLAVKDTSMLSLSYLQSQFDYYRGERAPGGVLGKSTPAGLDQSALFLKRAIGEDAHNALATFMLGHVLRKQGLQQAAREQYGRAYRVYVAEGHVPAGVKDAQDWARKPASKALGKGGSGS